VNLNIPDWPVVNRFLRLAAAWAAVLYPVISAIQGTSWGAKDTTLSVLGGALLWIEHYNATPNVTSTTTTTDPVPAPSMSTVTPSPPAGA
jgi:hypothetical protein